MSEAPCHISTNPLTIPKSPVTRTTPVSDGQVSIAILRSLPGSEGAVSGFLLLRGIGQSCLHAMMPCKTFGVAFCPTPFTRPRNPILASASSSPSISELPCTTRGQEGTLSNQRTWMLQVHWAEGARCNRLWDGFGHEGLPTSESWSRDLVSAKIHKKSSGKHTVFKVSS